jgi:hypothetical protein
MMISGWIPDVFSKIERFDCATGLLDEVSLRLENISVEVEIVWIWTGSLAIVQVIAVMMISIISPSEQRGFNIGR